MAVNAEGIALCGGRDVNEKSTGFFTFLLSVCQLALYLSELFHPEVISHGRVTAKMFLKLT